MRGLIAGLMTALVFAGCTTTTLVTPAPVVLRSYDMGATDSTGIGEAIFDVTRGLRRPAFRFPSTFDPEMRAVGEIPSGALFRADRMTDDGDYVTTNRDWSISTNLVVSPDGTVRGTLFGMTAISPITNAPQLLQDDQIEGENAFRAQMIYGGRAGSIVRTQYREFTDDMIRAAFTQDLEFDLSEENVIAYRSIRIEVVEATNTFIRYRVVDDGGLEWLP